jgi:hypothetical protein
VTHEECLGQGEGVRSPQWRRGNGEAVDTPQDGGAQRRKDLVAVGGDSGVVLRLGESEEHVRSQSI